MNGNAYLHSHVYGYAFKYVEIFPLFSIVIIVLSFKVVLLSFKFLIGSLSPFFNVYIIIFFQS